ncbi:MAG: PhnD/SsuA/transferrin family substrate-binding protein [Methyloligellaceae bacterium]
MALLAAGSRTLASGDLRFGLTPVFLTNDLELLERLQSYLANMTGRTVRLIQRRTYQEITALLISGQLDAAWICGYPYIRYRDQLQLLALPVWNGRPLYQSYLIVDDDRAAKDIGDLRGDIHAFSDPDSNSGYLVTTALLAERDLRPSEFFGRTFFTYGHRNVVRAVSSGLAGSGSVDGYVWEVLNETEPQLTNRTRILRKSEWLGFPPIAGPAVPRDVAATRLLTDALMSMDRHEEGRQILHMLRLDRFEKHGPALFDQIATKVKQVQRLG